MNTTVSHVDALAAMSPRRRVEEAQQRLESVSKLIDGDTFAFLCAYNKCQFELAGAIDRSRKRAREEYTLRDLIRDEERITPATVWSDIRRRTDGEIQTVHREITKVVRHLDNILPLCVRKNNMVDDLVRSKAIVERCVKLSIRPDEVRNIEELRARGGVLPEESDETFFENYLERTRQRYIDQHTRLRNHYRYLMNARLHLEERIALY